MNPREGAVEAVKRRMIVSALQAEGGNSRGGEEAGD
jgi:hypothetical protein